MHESDTSRLKQYQVYIFYLLYLIELLWLIIDTISGYFLNNNISFLGNQSIGSLIRIFVFLLLFYINLKWYNFNNNFVFLIIVVLFSLTFIHIMQAKTAIDVSFLSTIVKYYQNVIKIVLPVLFYFAVRIQIKKNLLTFSRLKKIIYLNSSILLINVFLFLFGIGFPRYGMTDKGEFQASVGYFFAGNEVSATMITLLAILQATLMHKNILLQLIVSAFFIAAALLTGSKVAIFGSLLIFMFGIILRLSARKFMKFMPLAVSILVAVYFVLQDSVMKTINRWKYFIDLYGIIYTLGGIKRFNAIADYINDLKDSPSLFFYGVGWSGVCENGFFDLLQGYGIFGIMLYSVWFFWLFVIIKRMLKKNTMPIKISVLGYMLILGASYFAGHVVQSAMLAPFVAFLVHSDKLIPHPSQKHDE